MLARQFRFLQTLGEGAFGAVHLAEVREEEDFVQTLAVKWLHPRWSQNPEYAKRLRDEARLLALLRHDNIVRVHGLTRIEGRLAILMEYIEGADLGHVQQLPPTAALEVCAAVADALDAAWSDVPPGGTEPLHVVHRDIKPSNVMVTPRGAVKVMDFGVARARFDSREAQTRSQQFGTARYMAPERWLDGVSEAPSDVFSLGVTLVELLTGTAMAQARLSQEGFERDVGQALESLDAWPQVRELAQQMLAFKASDRPSAHQVADTATRLAAALDGTRLRDWATATVPGLTEPGEDTSLTGTIHAESSLSSETVDLEALVAPTAMKTLLSRPTPEAVEERPARGRWLALGVVLLLGLAGATSQLVTADPTTTPPPQPAAEVASPAPALPAPAAAAPAPEPVVDVAPQPRPPSPRPAPAPATEPAPDQAAADEPALDQTALVSFHLADGVQLRTSAGLVTRPRQALPFPVGSLQAVTVILDDREIPCTVQVGEGLTEVVIDADGACSGG